VLELEEKSQLMQPLDKLAELARAHGAKHEEGGAVVESALSPNVREPCVQRRVVCRNRVSTSQRGHEDREYRATCDLRGVRQ
jgi:hypothetical protein